MSKQSLFFSFADYLSYILCAQIRKPQQSRLHRKCCNVCVLKDLRLRDQHACLLTSLTTAPLRQTACLFVLKQALCLVFPPGSSGKKKKKLNSVWHWTSKTKCREVDGTTEGKGQASNFVLPVYFILLRLADLSHQGLGVFCSCEVLCRCFGDQTGHRLKRVSEWDGAVNGFEKCAERWMRSHWGTGKYEDSHCCPSKTPSLKTKSRYAHKRPYTLKPPFFPFFFLFFFLEG